MKLYLIYRKKNYRDVFTMRIMLLFVLLVLSFSGQTQVRVRTIDTTHLPKGVKYEGTIKAAVEWTDIMGYNIVILTETGIGRSKEFTHEKDGTDAELFAYHFSGRKDSMIQIWKVYDFISDCPVELEASFIDSTFQITDLNKDGMSEIWLMYKTACHGDVSPCEMKIIMYEGPYKFAMRGQNKVFEGTDDKGKKHYIGGDYKYDEAFASGPKEFLAFAKALWNKHITGK